MRSHAIISVMNAGKFITFEGPDGSGKTTVSKAVVKKLSEEGYSLIYTREPGGSEIAEQIRNVILDPQNTLMDARTEALLYAASRRQHLVEIVKPAMAQGITVISDRFIDSSLAYQGIARGIGIDPVYEINAFAIDDCMPDKTIYLDVSAEEGLKRIADRVFLDRMDKESVSFHQKVREGYMQILAKYPERIIRVDAARDLDVVVEEACRLVREIIDGSPEKQ